MDLPPGALARLMEMKQARRKSAVTPEQTHRALVVLEAVKDYVRQSKEDWLAGFQADSDPEMEIRTWEWIRHSFESYVGSRLPPGPVRAELFSVMVLYSMSPSAEDVVRMNPPKLISVGEAMAAMKHMDACRAAVGARPNAPINISFEPKPPPPQN